jgi:hypothetical protein
LYFPVQEHLQNKPSRATLPGRIEAVAMIDIQTVQSELSHARASRLAAVEAGDEMEALVHEMQQHHWALLAFVDENYDPRLFAKPN